MTSLARARLFLSLCVLGGIALISYGAVAGGSRGITVLVLGVAVLVCDVGLLIAIERRTRR